VLLFPEELLGELFDPLPAQFVEFLATARHAISSDPRPVVNVLREFDAGTYFHGAILSGMDRMSMQHSLELRAPLLGIDVARFAMSLASQDCYRERRGKLVLKQVASRHLPLEWLSRRKQSFDAPISEEACRALASAMRDDILSSDGALRKWFAPARLERLTERVTRQLHPHRIWAMFVLEEWLRSHPAMPAGN
jgi:asparagine synthase (glutamine-hydrolysing)